MKKRIALSVLAGALIGCSAKTPEIESTPSQSSFQQTPQFESLETPELQETLQADVQLTREIFYPGEEIEVIAVAVGLDDAAWVGIVPSSAPPRAHLEKGDNNLDHAFLKDVDRLFLVAPREAGDYDVRLHPAQEGGNKVASRSFKVEVDPGPVREPKLLWTPEPPLLTGSTFEVPFQAPLDYPKSAWIGIVASGVPHGPVPDDDAVKLSPVPLEGRTRGKVLLTVPLETGDFDVRLYDSEDPQTGKEVDSLSFQATEE